MLRRLLALTLMAGALGPGISIAAPSRPALTAQQTASIDAFVMAEMRRQHVPGVAVGL